MRQEPFVFFLLSVRINVFLCGVEQLAVGDPHFIIFYPLKKFGQLRGGFPECGFFFPLIAHIFCSKNIKKGTWGISLLFSGRFDVSFLQIIRMGGNNQGLKQKRRKQMINQEFLYPSKFVPIASRLFFFVGKF